MSLPANTSATVSRAFKQAVALLGTPMTMVSPQGEVIAVSLTCGLRMVGLDDINIVNAYGIETRIITVDADLVQRPPVQYDAFLLGSARFVVQAIREVRMNDTLLGYKCYCRSQ